MTKPVLVIAGPTGSGKSGLALECARAHGGVIINADSMQVYENFPILTAQPDEAARKTAPHRLYGTVLPPALSSAAAWQKEAAREIDIAHAAGQLPIIVGGTGLYLEALMHGFSEIPDVPVEIREEVKALHAEIGGAALRQKLAAVDALSASRLHDGDTQRLIRAYEVYLATGQPLSHWQRAGIQAPPCEWRFFSIVLLPDREELYEKIDARFLHFMKMGALEEARQAKALAIPEGHPALKALGLKELCEHLECRFSEAESINKAQQASRNYAKRQYTWFKNRFMKKEMGAGRIHVTLAKPDFAEANAAFAAFLRNSG